jgi:hypothetical protein
VRHGAKLSAFVVPLAARWTNSKNAAWGKARKRHARHRAYALGGGHVEPVIGCTFTFMRPGGLAHPSHRYLAISNRPRLLQYRSTICSSFLLSNQDRPRNATNITMPRPEEALFMDASEN